MATHRPRMKLCRNYALGNCRQGDDCKYIHSDRIVYAPTFIIAPQHPMPPPYHGGISPTSPYSISSPPMSWAVAPRGAAPNQAYPTNWEVQVAPTGQDHNATRPPQYRALSWRTTLCRHFVKNQGWCPLGDECGYIHDLDLARHARNDIRYPDGRRPRSLGPLKQSHCWAYVQGMCRVRDCPYIHPIALDLFIPHTPCLSWPNCDKGPLCCYKHPEPLIPSLSNVHPRAISNIPAGTYQAQGTTYFPLVQDRNVPISPTAPVPYSPSIRSGFSPYSNASLPYFSPVYEPKRAPFIAPPLVAIASNSSEDGNRYVGMPPPIPFKDPSIAGGLKADVTSTVGEKAPEDFPYRPPAHQRPGHARRISVTLKSKEDSDALGLSHARDSRRPSWMTHSKRDAETHRSWPWAPESSGAASAPSSKTDFGF